MNNEPAFITALTAAFPAVESRDVEYGDSISVALSLDDGVLTDHEVTIDTTGTPVLVVTLAGEDGEPIADDTATSEIDAVAVARRLVDAEIAQHAQTGRWS